MWSCSHTVVNKLIVFNLWQNEKGTMKHSLYWFNFCEPHTMVVVRLLLFFFFLVFPFHDDAPTVVTNQTVCMQCSRCSELINNINSTCNYWTIARHQALSFNLSSEKINSRFAALFKSCVFCCAAIKKKHKRCPVSICGCFAFRFRRFVLVRFSVMTAVYTILNYILHQHT